MADMHNIQENIEEIISAINAVLQVDVTVIDKYHNRIAATGRYIDRIGEKVSKDSIFYQALTKGEAYIVESPRVDPLCRACERQEDCEEFAEVCCPIFINGTVVGIIGLVAFDQYQKDQILSNKLNLLNFLENMAALISSKMKEKEIGDKWIEQSKAMEALLNYMDSGVVSIDTHGRVLACNCKAKHTLGFKNVDHIGELIEDFKVSRYPESHVFEKELEGHIERFRYKTKPIIIDQVLKQVVITISQEKEWIHVLNDLVHTRQVVTFDDIIGQSPLTLKAIETGKQSAKSMSTVLIQGPSGTGKELFARAIHNESDRRHQPFVAINCAAIPESLIESELFGYVEGAFTGAVKGGKPGKFEMANKGTIFLDEIGDMPIHLQSKLLRVLQEREVERIGSAYSLPVDVKVIAASHQDLEALIHEKNFRLDLYYRLNVIPLYLQPLKNRREDIKALSCFFLKRYKEKLNKGIDGFHESVRAYFHTYPWPGNIREMENAVEYSVNMCEGGLVMLRHLPPKMNDSHKEGQESLMMDLKLLEKKAICQAVETYGKSKEAIATITDILKISRATLYRKIKDYGL